MNINELQKSITKFEIEKDKLEELLLYLENKEIKKTF